MRQLIVAACGAALLALAACTTQTERVVPDNSIRPDTTISLLEREAYLNRLYISLLGRKPDAAESQAAFSSFEADGCGPQSRTQLVAGLMNRPEFYDNVYRSLRRDYLNDLDTATIRWQLEEWKRTIDQLERDHPTWATVVRQYITRLERLQALPDDLAAGRIDLIEAHRRCVQNNFYDEINMGTENFVVSCFSHFLSRYPTLIELEQGKRMVDAQPAELFGRYGRSQNDFLDAFFGHTGYFEGQVKLLYQRYLYREPRPDEASALVRQYTSTRDWKALWRHLLTSSDYVRSR